MPRNKTQKGFRESDLISRAGMKYWLCVVTNPSAYERIDKHDQCYQCLPIAAKVDDIFVIYRGSRVIPGKAGISAIGKVGHQMVGNDDLCGAYYSSVFGRLNPFSCNISVRLDRAITRKSMAADTILRESQMVRRNFQGSVFELSSVQWESIQRIIKLQLNKTFEV